MLTSVAVSSSVPYIIRIVFFALYANVDGYDATTCEAVKADAPEIDRWIISKLNSLIKGVTAELEDFDPTRAGRLIDSFVNNDLSTGTFV